MSKLYLVLIAALFCVNTFAQNKYSLAAKKSFKEGNKAYTENRNEDAIKFFTEALEKESGFAEAYLNRSIVYLKMVDFKNAFSDAKKAYAIAPLQSAIHNQLGKCYYNDGHLDSAKYFLEKGTNVSSPSDEDLYYLANVHSDLGDYNSAIESYSSLLKNHPENSAILNQRGISYFKIGEYSKAEEDFLHALEHEPENISIYSNLANAAIEANDTTKAIQYIDRGINKATGHAKMEFLILKGNYFFKLERYSEASEFYNEAYAIENENPIVLTNQASIMIQTGNYEGAIAKCTAAIEHNPEFMQAYFNRGIAYEMVRDTRQACMDWEEAFILGSTQAEEYLNSPACSE